MQHLHGFGKTLMTSCFTPRRHLNGYGGRRNNFNLLSIICHISPTRSRIRVCAGKIGDTAVFCRQDPVTGGQKTRGAGPGNKNEDTGGRQ